MKNPFYIPIEPEPRNPYYKKVSLPKPDEQPDKQQPIEQQPIEQKPVEQTPTKQVTIPDKWNFEITGNSIEEVNSKVDKIKSQFPEVPIEETNGIRNIRIKGNPELSKRVYSYLNDIPYTPEKLPEFQTEEQQITAEPKAEPTVSDMLDPLIDIAFNPNQDPYSKTLKLMNHAKSVTERYTGTFDFNVANKFKNEMQGLTDMFNVATENISKGYQDKDFTKLSNGIMGVTMAMMDAPLSLMRSLPGGKIASDLIMLEPSYLGEKVSKGLEPLKLNPDLNELITNVVTLGALHFKGQLLKTDNIPQSRIETEKFIKKQTDFFVDEYGRVTTGKESMLPATIENIKSLQDIQTKENARLNALNKINTQIKDVTTNISKENDPVKLEELETNLNKLEGRKKKWEEKAQKEEQPKEEVKNETSPESTSKPIENKGGLEEGEVKKRNLGEEIQFNRSYGLRGEKSEITKGKINLIDKNAEGDTMYGVLFTDKKGNERQTYTLEKDIADSKANSETKPTEKQPYEMTKDEYVTSVIENTPKKDLRGFKLNETVLRSNEEHKNAIEQALKDGKTIPEEVLKDHPELKPKEERTIEKTIAPYTKLSAEKYDLMNQLKDVQDIIDSEGIEGLKKKGYQVIGTGSNTIGNDTRLISIKLPNGEMPIYLSKIKDTYNKISKEFPVSKRMAELQDGLREAKRRTEKIEKKEPDGYGRFMDYPADVEYWRAEVKRFNGEITKEKTRERKYYQAKEGFNQLPDKLSSNPADFYAKKLKDLTIIGAYHLENGITSFKGWATKMISEVGDWIRPHLKKLWNEVSNPNNIKDRVPDLITQGMGVQKKLNIREFAQKLQKETGTLPKDWRRKWDEYNSEKVETKTEPKIETEVKPEIKTESRKIEGSVTRTTEKRDEGFTNTQRAVFEAFNPFEPFQRYEKEGKSESPTVQAFNLLKKQTYATNWITGKETPIIQKDGNVKLEKGSMIDLAKMVKGDETKFAEYLIARRVVEDNNKLKTLTDPERIKQIEDFLKTDNFDLQDAQRIINQRKGKFTEAEKFYDDMNRRLIDFAENTGLLSEEKANQYRSEKGYASFQRDFSNENSPLYTSTNSQSKLKSQKSRTGSQRQILDPVFSLKNAIIETTGKGLENNVWRSLANLSEKVPELKERFTEAPESNSTIKVWDNGKVKYYDPAPEFKAVWENLRPQDRGLFTQLLRIPTNAFVRLTTSANPLFPLRNLTVDQVSAMANTKTGLSPINTIKNLFDLIKSKETRKEFQEYKRIGGERQTFASSMELNPEQFTNRLLGQYDTKGQRIVSQISKGVNTGLSVLEIPSNFTELLTRFSEFKRAKRIGNTDIEALYKASQVTTPFERRGNYGGSGMVKELVSMIPYANANMQVFYKTLKTAQQQPLRLATVGAGTILTGLAFSNLTMTYGSPDQKRELSQMPTTELARNLYIPKPSGKGFVKLRIPEQFGSLLALGQIATFSMNGLRKFKGKDVTDALGQMLPQQMNVLEPTKMLWSWIPQFAKPTLEAGLNMKSYPEFAPIVPEYMRDNELPKEQYTEYTTKTGKFLGELFGASPMLIDHWVKGTLGQTGSLVYGLPESLEKLGNPLGTQSDKFIMSGVAYNDFYDKLENLKREYNHIKDSGDRNLIKETERKKALYDEVSDVLSDARKVLKLKKELPNFTKERMFDLLINLQNDKPENQIIMELEQLSNDVEKLKKENNLKTRNNLFTRTGFDKNRETQINKIFEEKKTTQRRY